MKNLRLILLCLASAIACSAEPIKLTRAQATELFSALAKLEAGLAPANAISAADNLTELRPVAESRDKGLLAAQRAMRALPAGDTREAEAQKILDAFEAKLAEELRLDLARLDLTPEEIAAAKIPPRDLAIIRQHLRPKK